MVHHYPASFLLTRLFLSCFFIHRSKTGKKRYPDWLVVDLPTPLKNDGVKVSWDYEITNIYIWTVIKFHGSKPVTNQLKFMIKMDSFPSAKNAPSRPQRTDGRSFQVKSIKFPPVPTMWMAQWLNILRKPYPKN